MRNSVPNAVKNYNIKHTKVYYITGQNRTRVKGYNAGNYHFGFTTFGGVGCEVASVYNLLK